MLSGLLPAVPAPVLVKGIESVQDDTRTKRRVKKHDVVLVLPLVILAEVVLVPALLGVLHCCVLRSTG